MGNGKDVLFLSQLTFDGQYHLTAYDIQEAALLSTRALVQKELNIELTGNASHFFGHGLSLKLACHSKIAHEEELKATKLIHFNLGYLPGSDKQVTTMTGTTMTALQELAPLLPQNSAITLVCYPHLEGKREEMAILDWAYGLNSTAWQVTHHKWVNRLESPSAVVIERRG